MTAPEVSRPIEPQIGTTRPSATVRARARMQNPTLRAYLALFLGAACIGFSAIFTKWANVPGPVSAFYRVSIATVALVLPYSFHVVRQRAAQQNRGRFNAGAFWLTALAGLFFALDLGFWNTSLRFTSAANSTLLGNTSTLWVSLGALIIFHESLKRRFWLGMAIALLGAAIVVGRDVFEHPHLGWGDLLAVGSSTFYAGYMLTTQRARQHVGTLSFMWLSSLVATLALFAYVLVTGEQLLGFSVNTWISLFALALVSHVLGWLSINYALGHLPASLTAVSLLSQPVMTALIAVPLLAEPLSVYQIGGGILVLCGIYIVNRR